MLAYSNDYGGTCMHELNRRMTQRSDETMWIAGTYILIPGWVESDSGKPATWWVKSSWVESYPYELTRNRSNSDELMTSKENNRIDFLFFLHFLFASCIWMIFIYRRIRYCLYCPSVLKTDRTMNTIRKKEKQESNDIYVDETISTGKKSRTPKQATIHIHTRSSFRFKALHSRCESAFFMSIVRVESTQP